MNAWKEVPSDDAKELIAPGTSEKFVYDGVKYIVDNKNVVADYQDNDLRVGNLAAKVYGKDVTMYPRVLNPENISTSDFGIKGNDGEYIKYELKTPEESYGGIVNRISKARGQSERFFIDVSTLENKIGFSKTKILNQLKRVFSSKSCMHAQEVIIVRGSKIIYAYRKK
jgi:hypothetical protein